MKTKSLVHLILIFLLVFNSVTFAQKGKKYECKYSKDVIDDFTKNRTVITGQATVFDLKKTSITDMALGSFGRMAMAVIGNNINGANCLEFHWLGQKKEWVKQFNQLDLLLENGEVVSIKEEVASEYRMVGSFYDSGKLFTIENDSIWLQLKVSPLKKLRLFLNGKDLGSVEVEKEYSTSFMDVINCIDKLGIPTRHKEMTSDEALSELKKAKDKLDLEIITQAQYDSLKAEYIKYIK